MQSSSIVISKEKNINQNNPLREICAAAATNRVGDIKELIEQAKEKGIHMDINARESRFDLGWSAVYLGPCTPLMAAAKNGHYEACVLLIETYGAKVRVLGGRLEDYNALDCAMAWGGNPKLVTYLAEQYISQFNPQSALNKTLDLSSFYISDKAIVSLKTALSVGQSIVKLVLKPNHLTIDGMKALGEILEQTTTLKLLDLSADEASADDSIPIHQIKRPLSNFNKSKQPSKGVVAQLNDGLDYLSELSTALASHDEIEHDYSKDLKILKSLVHGTDYLRDLQTLGYLANSLVQNKSLVKLILNGWVIDVNAFRVTFLPLFKSPRSNVALECIELDADVLEALSDEERDQLPRNYVNEQDYLDPHRLNNQSTIYRYHGQVTRDSEEFWNTLRLVSENRAMIDVFDLSGATFFDKGFFYNAYVPIANRSQFLNMLSNNTTLKKLILRDSNLDDQTVKAMVDALIQNPQASVALDLSHNAKLTKKSAKAIKKLLKHCENIPLPILDKCENMDVFWREKLKSTIAERSKPSTAHTNQQDIVPLQPQSANQPDKTMESAVKESKQEVKEEEEKEGLSNNQQNMTLPEVSPIICITETEITNDQSSWDKLKQDIATLKNSQGDHSEKIALLEQRCDDLRILLRYKRERYEAQQEIHQNINCKVYYETLITRIENLFVGSKGVGSGLINTSQMGVLCWLSMAVTLLSELPIPELHEFTVAFGFLAEAMKHIDQERQNNYVARMGGLANIKECNKIAEYIARQLTFRYQDQLIAISNKHCIRQKDIVESMFHGIHEGLEVAKQFVLNEAVLTSIDTLIAFALLRMMAAMQAGEIQSHRKWPDDNYKVIADQLLVEITKPLSTQEKLLNTIYEKFEAHTIETINGRKWTVTGFYFMPGIRVLRQSGNYDEYEGKVGDIQTNSSCYGFRWGSSEEVQQWGLKQVRLVKVEQTLQEEQPKKKEVTPFQKHTVASKGKQEGRFFPTKDHFDKVEKDAREAKEKTGKLNTQINDMQQDMIKVKKELKDLKEIVKRKDEKINKLTQTKHDLRRQLQNPSLLFKNFNFHNQAKSDINQKPLLVSMEQKKMKRWTF